MSREDNSIPNLTPEEATNIIAATAACWRVGVPTFWWGVPGEGKSALHKAMATAAEAWFCPWILSQRSPEDLGFPYEGEMEGPGGRMLKVVKRSNPAEFVKACLLAEQGKRSLHFFDEVNTPDDSIRKAVMTVLSDRYIGDLDLSDPLIMMAAAGNPPGQGVGAMDLEPAMASRFAHFQWGRLPGSWVDRGLTEGWQVPAVPAWCSDEALAQGRKDMTHKMVAFNRNTGRKWSQQKPVRGCWGWGNSRTFDWATRALGAAAAMGLSIEQEGLIVDGLLGRGAGVEWCSFREATSTLMDPEQALAMKMRGEEVPFPGRGDLVYALVESIVAAVLNHPGGVTGERWEAAFKVLFQSEQNADIAVDPGTRLMRHQPCVAGSKKRWPMPKEALNLVALLRD